ncbi:MAG: efflux RND transporter permease subunit [Rubrivivax sp.]
MDGIRSALYSASGERQVSTIYTPVDSYQVIMEAAPSDKQDETAFNGVHAFHHRRAGAADGLLHRQRTVGPTAINHVGQLQAVTVSFNLAPGVALGDATARIDQLRTETGLPSSVITSYGGDAAVFKSSQGSQAILISLGAAGHLRRWARPPTRSYIHPITILAGPPLAAVGALLTPSCSTWTSTLIATIGILLLIGIVKKNAIMMIDFALEQQRHHGQDPTHAIREACILRFRPIMMTTMAALMGALPIALGIGAGAELRQPLGLAVCGDGLVFSQAITLYITPVIYLLLDCFSGRGPVTTAEEVAA